MEFDTFPGVFVVYVVALHALLHLPHELHRALRRARVIARSIERQPLRRFVGVIVVIYVATSACVSSAPVIYYGSEAFERTAAHGQKVSEIEPSAPIQKAPSMQGWQGYIHTKGGKSTAQAL